MISTQYTAHSDSFPLMTDHDPHVLPAKKNMTAQMYENHKSPELLEIYS